MEKLIYIIIIGSAVFALAMVISIINGGQVSLKNDLRLEQAKKQKDKKEKKSDVESTRSLLEAMAKPLNETVFETYKPKNLAKEARKLKITGWDKYFTPITWLSLRVWMGLVGLLFAWLIYAESWIAAVVILILCIQIPVMLLNNEYNNIRDDLLINFPETLRIIAGYLSTGLTMQRSFEMAAKHAKPRWQNLLLRFVHESDTKGTLAALDWIKEEIDIMEAREFFASIRLAIEDGISPLESFDKQATIIQRLLDDAILKRIEQRKMLGTVLQGPLLMLVLVTFALPMVGQIMDFF